MEKFRQINKSSWRDGGLAFETFRMGLPLPRQKNLLNIAFPASESPERNLMQISKIRSYSFNNQLNARFILRVKGLFLRFKTTYTDFEFNKPILKKRARIFKDFEKY